MPVTIIAHVTVNEEAPEALAKYLEITGPLLTKARAEIKTRFVLNEAVVGHRPSQTVMLVEYPDHAAVDMVFQSEEYKNIAPIRDAAFLDYHVTMVAE